MKDRLITVAVSVLTTMIVMSLWGRSIPQAALAEPAPAASPASLKELVVDRLIVHKELIVSDTGRPWQDGFEQQQIAREFVARSPAMEVTGAWVRDRLIKTEIDDPFDDRFHAVSSDGSVYRAPGHISWNVWLDRAWRQLVIIQGEGLEHSEVGRKESGPAPIIPGGYASNHSGRITLTRSPMPTSARE
jgi:hypothetical protein